MATVASPVPQRAESPNGSSFAVSHRKGECFLRVSTLHAARAEGSVCAPGPAACVLAAAFRGRKQTGGSARRARSDGVPAQSSSTKPAAQSCRYFFVLHPPPPLPSTLSCGLVRPSRQHGSPRNARVHLPLAPGVKASVFETCHAQRCVCLAADTLFVPFLLSFPPAALVIFVVNSFHCAAHVGERAVETAPRARRESREKEEHGNGASVSIFFVPHPVVVFFLRAPFSPAPSLFSSIACSLLLDPGRRVLQYAAYLQIEKDPRRTTFSFLCVCCRGVRQPACSAVWPVVGSSAVGRCGCGTRFRKPLVGRSLGGYDYMLPPRI
ncbi:hypothetical protein HPB52_004633 [Rhipicephalus sanguineus]|uniref:Uncharacterized protein n=1 Tax=Rhipicephalus sanguineus TaxID=34632 RepID=A0A9D4PCP5_RHISA|nr:hypothetical protein HPB52_004633 [Rhipicephalus sanguineus]